MGDKNVFSERLKELLEKNNVSARKLGLTIGKAPSLITRYLSGERSPSGDVVVKVAKFFNVSTDYLLGNSDVPMPTYGEYDPLQYLPKELRDKLSVLEKTPTPENLESVGKFLIDLAKTLKDHSKD